MSELVLWDKARAALAALAQATHLDQVVKVRDDTAKLRVLSRLAENDELERLASEVHLRALQRIGEISLELAKAQGKRSDKKPLPNDGQKSKAQLLEKAGISTSTAQRCERLTGKTVKEREDASRATEKYFGEQRAAGQPVSYDGLLKAVDDALGRAINLQEARMTKGKVVNGQSDLRAVDSKKVNRPLQERPARRAAGDSRKPLLTDDPEGLVADYTHRADEARKLAVYDDGPVRQHMIDDAAEVIEAWSTLKGSLFRRQAAPTAR